MKRAGQHNGKPAQNGVYIGRHQQRRAPLLHQQNCRVRVDAASFVSPAEAAVNTCWPMAKLEIVMLAKPASQGTAVPSGAVPSKNITLPPGVAPCRGGAPQHQRRLRGCLLEHIVQHL